MFLSLSQLFSLGKVEPLTSMSLEKVVCMQLLRDQKRERISSLPKKKKCHKEENSFFFLVEKKIITEFRPIVTLFSMTVISHPKRWNSGSQKPRDAQVFQPLFQREFGPHEKV